MPGIRKLRTTWKGTLMPPVEGGQKLKESPKGKLQKLTYHSFGLLLETPARVPKA